MGFYLLQSHLSLMSLAATALVLIGIGFAFKALVLVLPDREPDGQVRPSSLARRRVGRLRLIHGGKKGSQGGSR
jgi:hypothetical protein